MCSPVRSGKIPFLSTPSARRATEPAAYCLGSKKFLPTPSARRATGAVFVFARYTDISTHALREEGDRVFLRSICPLRNFYPRPPRGGRPRQKGHHHRGRLHFYPRPPRGGRRGQMEQSRSNRRFLSTPSARRATCGRCQTAHGVDISIHALREEGDLLNCCFRKFHLHFYPRPPRGGRLSDTIFK